MTKSNSLRGWKGRLARYTNEVIPCSSVSGLRYRWSRLLTKRWSDSLFAALAVDGSQPCRRLRGPLEVEPPRPHNLVDVHFGLDRREDDGVGVEGADHLVNPVELPNTDPVDLVDNYHVGELQLRHQQVGDGPVVLPVHGQPSLRQLLGPAHVREEACGVDHRDHGVDLGQVEQTVGAPVLDGEGEGLGDGERLADPRALDDEVVVPSASGEGGDLSEEVLPEGAADAAVAQLNDGPPQRAVDVQFAHVVHDDREPSVRGSLCEQTSQQSGLPRSQEARDDRHGQPPPRALAAGAQSHPRRSPRTRGALPAQRLGKSD